MSVGPVLRWYLAMLFIMAGMMAIKATQDSGQIDALIVAVLCFGAAYWMSKAWLEVSGKLVLVGLSVLAVSGVAAYFSRWYIPGFLQLPHFLFWALYTFIIGLPVMLWAFKKYKD